MMSNANFKSKHSQIAKMIMLRKTDKVRGTKWVQEKIERVEKRINPIVLKEKNIEKTEKEKMATKATPRVTARPKGPGPGLRLG
ncbi:hypothetical protein LguiA_029901 [Lonicera macranthoides]